MKKRINPAAWSKLSDELKAEYELKDGNYVLKLEADDGDDDSDDTSSAAVRAKNHEKQKRQEAERKLREAEERLAAIDAEKEAAANEGAKKKGDTEALEKSWKAKTDKQKAEYEAEIAKHKSALQKQLVDRVAAELAAELTDHPKLMLPQIKARLAADWDEAGEATTRILDANGQPSASSIADLKKEFLTDKAFSPIIRGNKSSGGASGSKNSTAPRTPMTSGQGGERKKLADMPAAEANAHLKALHEARFPTSD